MHERSSPRLAVFGARDGKLPMGVLRIETDEGVAGTNFLSYPGPGPLAIAREIVTFVKPLLVGADPLEIGRHWRRLRNLSHFISPITAGVVDVALWDIAGRRPGYRFTACSAPVGTGCRCTCLRRTTRAP